MAEQKEQEYKEELEKGKELIGELQKREGELRRKEREGEEMRGRVEEQKRGINGLAGEAKRLENEIDRNLEMSKQLSAVHAELMENLLRFSDQDEKIRELLNRRA